MIMTTRTQKTHAHPNLSSGCDAINDIFSPVFLIDHTTLNGNRVVAVKSGGNFLVQISIRQEITCKLFDGKLIKRQVTVVGIDHPVTPGPHAAVRVVLVTIGIGIAGGIKPVTRHVFAITRRSQQAINHFLISVGGFIRKKTIKFGKRRRQTGQIKGYPA